LLELSLVPEDASQLRRAYGAFPSGVTAVCALVDGAPVGMAASSFTAVSVNPPLVSVCVRRESQTWPFLRHCDYFGISILATGQELVCRRLSDKSNDRFGGVVWDQTVGGAIFVEGACAWLECSLHREIVAGDHLIVLFLIHTMCTHDRREPLVFHGSKFRQMAVSNLSYP